MANVAVIDGRLTHTPELKYTQSGIASLSFSLAVQRSFKNEKGEYDVDFIDVVAWKQKAEFIAKYAEKGSKIMVVGRIQKRDYTAKDGTKRYVTEIVAEDVELLSKPSRTEADEAQAEAPQGMTEVAEDDVPF